MKHTKSTFRSYLLTADGKQNASVSVFKLYKLFIMKEKAIYEHINYLNNHGNIFTGLVWCPRSFDFISKIEEIKIEQGLTALQVELGPEEVPGLIKPTLFKCNDFIWAFQEITNTYGIPNYKEANPSMVNIVTFPFLFGVMFGDIMHGIWLLVFSTWLCWADRSKTGTLANSLAPVRYLFLLMGVFSTFMGFIYNDFSSMTT